MSGAHAHVAGHLLKRTFQAAQAHYSAQQDQIAQLQSDAELYENAGPNMEVSPWQTLPIVITAIAMFLVVASIDYTVGSVMSSLAMIESPTATAIVEDKPPAYADEPDAPLEKEPLMMPAEAEADVEVTLIANKPVTAKITTTYKHLRQVGGYRAKWRGLGVSIVYHMLHSFLTNLLSGFLGLGLMGHALMYIVSTVGLSRVHMAWTHSMVAFPSSKPFWKRMVPRKQCKSLLLPSLVFATAMQATYILPLVVAYVMGLQDVRMTPEDVAAAGDHKNCGKMVALGLRVLAVPATGLFVAFAILLPATVTLTRIEALLLPETEDTIVPFDRQAIVGDIDINARGSARKLFVSAWRSFDRASRWRLIKLYVKGVLLQIGVVLVGLQLMVAEVYLIGGEKLGLLFKSGSAQLQLMAIEAHDNAQ